MAYFILASTSNWWMPKKFTAFVAASRWSNDGYQHLSGCNNYALSYAIGSSAKRWQGVRAARRWLHSHSWHYSKPFSCDVTAVDTLEVVTSCLQFIWWSCGAGSSTHSTEIYHLSTTRVFQPLILATTSLRMRLPSWFVPELTSRFKSMSDHTQTDCFLCRSLLIVIQLSCFQHLYPGYIKKEGKINNTCTRQFSILIR